MTLFSMKVSHFAMSSTAHTPLSLNDFNTNQATLTHWLEQQLASIKATTSLQTLEALRVNTLGRQAELTLLKRTLKDAPPEQKAHLGQALNALSTTLEQALDAQKQTLEAQALTQQLQTEQLDISLPGRPLSQGHLHPLTVIINDICTLFNNMGYTTLDDTLCPEIETDYYNFDHPARDMQDTYYTTLAPNVLLRSQTSNAQIRAMSQPKATPPFKLIAPGRVYRNEEVTNRKYVLFHQIEGLYVAENITFAHLKATLNTFIAQLFGGQPRKTRFRPSFFPFTEPSAEVDVECLFCQGKGCKVCSQSGWLEILGAGMVHPNVLKNCNIDPQRYSGFAFGMGVERLAMLRDAINDIRLFYQNDQRFLQQFNPSL
jgi:phenylalanyl-tRNA synthetase alpha chain